MTLMQGYCWDGLKVNYMDPSQSFNCSNLISAKQHETDLDEKDIKGISGLTKSSDLFWF